MAYIGIVCVRRVTLDEFIPFLDEDAELQKMAASRRRLLHDPFVTCIAGVQSELIPHVFGNVSRRLGSWKGLASGGGLLSGVDVLRRRHGALHVCAGSWSVALSVVAVSDASVVRWSQHRGALHFHQH